jgi:adenylylsulfate kinase
VTENPTRLREALLGQKGVVLWFTGLSGAGKSTIADALLARLLRRRILATVLDGDCIRTGLCKDLGFSIPDRTENLRRLAEVAALMADAGVVVITAFISPLRESRRLARNIIGSQRFQEIYISTPLDVCEARDVKGLYRKARKGEISNFTGIDSPFEAPEAPDLSLNTSRLTLECSLEALESLLENLNRIPADLGGL